MPEPTQNDQMTALLVAVTKMDGKLDTSLAVQALHSRDIAELRGKAEVHDRQIAVLQTARESDTEHLGRGISNKMAAWTMATGVAAIIGWIITLFVKSHGG